MPEVPSQDALRIAVTGTRGQVARALQALETPHEIVALGRPALDLARPGTVAPALARARPDIVVNAAAWTAVDLAESEEAAAMAVNRDGARAVAEAAADLGVPIVHVSTDYVFDGTLDRAYIEADTPRPQGAYGRSKLAGEDAVRTANPHHAILRTAWVWDHTPESEGGRNFRNTMLRLAETRDVLRVVADQHGTPTHAADIARAIVAVCERLVADPSLAGTYHMVSEGETTWAGFAEAIFVTSRANGGPSAEVEPIATAEYPTPAPRPANSRLDTARFRKTFAHALPHWRERVDAGGAS